MYTINQGTPLGVFTCISYYIHSKGSEAAHHPCFAHRIAKAIHGHRRDFFHFVIQELCIVAYEYKWDFIMVLDNKVIILT